MIGIRYRTRQIRLHKFKSLEIKQFVLDAGLSYNQGMSEKVTPSRQQYLDLKAQYPDCILFFRLGDFYETFDDDAHLCARELELVLTKRHENPMAGVPYHSAEHYIAQLVAKGYKVAVAEQMGDPGTGLMERQVRRVVTAGTITDPTLLDARKSNYLVALIRDERAGKAGLAYLEITTGEFACTQFSGATWQKQVEEELERLAPAELIEPLREEEPGIVGSQRRAMQDPRGFPRTPYEAFRWELGRTRRTLIDHFRVQSLDGFGCSDLPYAVRAAGAALEYAKETQKGNVPQIEKLVTYSTRGYMMLDAATRRNLELTEAVQGGERFPSGCVGPNPNADGGAVVAPMGRATPTPFRCVGSATGCSSGVL